MTAHVRSTYSIGPDEDYPSQLPVHWGKGGDLQWLCVVALVEKNPISIFAYLDESCADE